MNHLCLRLVPRTKEPKNEISFMFGVTITTVNFVFQMTKFNCYQKIMLNML